MKILYEDGNLIFLFLEENIKWYLYSGYYIKRKDTGYWYKLRLDAGTLYRNKELKKIKLLEMFLEKTIK